MNIKDAKQEISYALRAYHEKDELGNYCYPLVRQRPILLMGPPGIGKTAIMEQIAKENDVGLVAYTITHHTRQSAVGLPRIREKIYDGHPATVTEYTMSEIIDSVYACMERTGKREGILFIDEINCASETLAPTMLQFLQNKTFGSHKIPEGWMIVAAGNPPEYNKSVREFDIVTLDRIRLIDIDVDCEAWMEYAWNHEIHGAILSYLNIRKESFYLIRNNAEGKFFVTARGWEDLSQILKSYERLQIPVTEQLVVQFLQEEETAKSFTAYYQLYMKYGQDYGIPEILENQMDRKMRRQKTEMAKAGSFEERFTVTGLVLSYLNTSFGEYCKREKQIQTLHQALKYFKEYQPDGDMTVFYDFIQERKNSLKVKWDAQLISMIEYQVEKWVIAKLEEYQLEIKKDHLTEREIGFEKIKEQFQKELLERKNSILHVKNQLTQAFGFLEECFGDGQEMVLFMTELSKNERAMEYIADHGCEPYFKYSDRLLFRQRKEQLQGSIQELLDIEG